MTSSDLEAAFRARYGLNLPEGEVPWEPRGGLALLGRASGRAFDGRPVPAGLLTYLLACAQSAPSKSDLQQYAIVVLESEAQRERLSALPSLPAWTASAPLLLVFCADARRAKRIVAARGGVYAGDRLDTLVNAMGDAAIALSAFVIAAEAEGLTCCPLSVVRNHLEEVGGILGLPSRVVPFAGLALGWPAAEVPKWVTPRLPQAVVVHRERYDDSGLDAELAGYDERRHDLKPYRPEDQAHRARFGVRESFRWSDHVARRQSVVERPELRAYLEAHGFDLS